MVLLEVNNVIALSIIAQMGIKVNS